MSDRDLKEALGSSSSISLDVFEWTTRFLLIIIHFYLLSFASLTLSPTWKQQQQHINNSSWPTTLKPRTKQFLSTTPHVSALWRERSQMRQQRLGKLGTRLGRHQRRHCHGIVSRRRFDKTQYSLRWSMATTSNTFLPLLASSRTRLTGSKNDVPSEYNGTGLVGLVPCVHEKEISTKTIWCKQLDLRRTTHPPTLLFDDFLRLPCPMWRTAAADCQHSLHRKTNNLKY